MVAFFSLEKIFKNCYSLLFETMMWSKMPFIRRKIIEILETGKNDEFLRDSIDLLIKNSSFNIEYNYCFIPNLNRYYFIENIDKQTVI